MSIKKLAGQTVIYGLSSIIGRTLYFLLLPLYTHLFPETEFGIVTDVFVYISLLMIVFTYRIEMAFFRYGAEPGQRQRTFSTAFTSHLISSILLLLILLPLAPLLAGWSNYADRWELIALALGILFFDTLNEIPKANLRLKGRPLRFAAVQLTNIGINLGLNLFFYLLCPWLLKGNGGEVLQNLAAAIYFPSWGIRYIFISNLIASAVLFLLLLPEFRGYRFRLDRQLWRDMMRYALPLVVVGFSFSINEVFDRKMLPIWGSGSAEENMAALGVYGANYRLAMIIALFTQAFRYGAEPFFFQQKTEINAPQIYARVAQFFTLFGTLGFLSVSLLLGLFQLTHFLAEDYWEGLQVVPILLLANLMLGIYYNFSVWFKLTDRTRWGAWIGLMGAGITILLNYWWIPQYSYVGCAWATLICYTLMCVVSWWIGRRYYAVPYPLGRMGLYVLSAVAVLLLARLLSPASLVTELGVSTLLLLGWCGFIFFLEKKTLMPIFRRVVKRR